MNYKYFPHTDDDLKQMLERAGATSLDDLYADVILPAIQAWKTASR